MPRKLKAAIYARVSRKDLNLENQLQKLVPLAEARSFELVETYTEKMSGVKKARPQLHAMMEAARKGEFQVLLIWALDRLGRNQYTIIEHVIELDRLGIQIVSLQDSWLDTTTGPTRALILPILAWVAQQERERIIERTKAGMDTARGKGKNIGRPEKEFDVDQALKLRKQGYGIRDIAKRMNVAYATIYRRFAQTDSPSLLGNQSKKYREMQRDQGELPMRVRKRKVA